MFYKIVKSLTIFLLNDYRLLFLSFIFKYVLSQK